MSAGWTAPSAAQALQQHLDDTARVLIIGQGGAVYADEILRRCEQAQSRIITDAPSEAVLGKSQEFLVNDVKRVATEAASTLPRRTMRGQLM